MIPSGHSNMSEQNQTVGSLSETSFVELLRWVSDGAFTGILVLARDEIKKSIIFEQGKPVAARSNIMKESLGEMLISEGRLTKAQMEKSLEMIRGKEALHQGEALISLGLIDPALLNDLLRRQIMNRIYEVFTWSDGKYGLVPSIPKETAKIVVEESVLEIAFRGLVNKYKNSNVSGVVELAAKPIPVGGHSIDVAKLRLVGREMGLLRAVNGVASVQEVISKARIDEPIAWAMLLAFRDLGMIRLGANDPPRVSVGSQRPVSRPIVRTKSETDAPSSKKTEEVGTDILHRLELSNKQNLFELLGLKIGAPPAEVKAAYFSLAKIYHPDRLPPLLGKGERKEAETLFAKFSEAHTVLTNEAQRKEYEASLKLESSGLDAQHANEIVQSEIEFQKGQIQIRKGDIEGALETLRHAVALYDKEPEYYVYLGWALYRHGAKGKSAKEMSEGKSNIEKGVKLNDKLAQGFFYLGMIAKNDGDLARAKRMFGATLEIQKNHAEANSELRLLNMRDAKEQSGGLKGLFKKKE